MFNKTESRPQAAYLMEAEPRARCPTGEMRPMQAAELTATQR
jgi:hypothetical protein